VSGSVKPYRCIMQSIFRLPWSSDPIAPKMQLGQAALDSACLSPVMDVAVLNKLKRKRTESPEAFSPQWMHAVKKQRAEGDTVRQSPPVSVRLPVKSDREIVQPPATACDRDPPQSAAASQPAMSHTTTRHSPLQTTPTTIDTRPGQSQQPPIISPDTVKGMSADVSMTEVQAVPDNATDLTALQQVIENEFNMQILMKHNELRLIDQELAKCQVALEQLRRCELQPYPGAEGLSTAISSGTGPSVRPPTGLSQPSHAAPYGVTDGPYTRHYRQWLLHDPHFDPTPVHMLQYADSTLSADMRSTRHNSTGRKSVHKSSSSIGAAYEIPKSLPNYPVTSRKNKIALVKRSTDNQLVKLVCNHCHRSDFSNSQGFLNHCRIAHKVDYKSHDLAAIDCGQALDEHELANIPPDAHIVSAPKPAASRSSSTTTTPFKINTAVHPFNTTGVNTSSASSTPSSATSRRAATQPIRPTLQSTAKSASFQSSKIAPRLAAQFAKHNAGGNLEEAIARATQKIDFGSDEFLQSPDLIDSASPTTPADHSNDSVFGVPRAGSLAPGGAARPASRKGYRQPANSMRPSPLVPVPADMASTQRDENSSYIHGGGLESPHDPSVNLSPQTLDGNPGLVSDHEDDGSASEDEVPQAAIAHSLGVVPRRRGCEDSMDVDIAVDDDMDEHGVVIRRNSMLGEEHRSLKMAGASSRK
jgi:ADA HAT complex component 1